MSIHRLDKQFNCGKKADIKRKEQFNFPFGFGIKDSFVNSAAIDVVGVVVILVFFFIGLGMGACCKFLQITT